MSRLDDFAAPLTQVLERSAYVDASVTVTGMASVGANRATLLVDVDHAGNVIEAVAQIGSIQGIIRARDEGALLQLAAAAGCPVPRVLAVDDTFRSDDADVLITTRLPGLSIPRQILRSLLDDAAGDALAEQCGDALARLHTIAADAVPESVPRLDPADAHRDYVGWLTTTLDQLPTHHPAIRWGLNQLRREPPSVPDRHTLVHADFRNGNMLVDEGRLTAMIDWELAHVGDPMEDLAWICLRMWRFGNDDRPVGGFGSIEALRRGYEAAGGVWRDDAFDWWLAARSAWWGIGLAQQAAAFRAGLSTSIVHAASGRRVPELEYDLLTLIRDRET
ncbi:MAG: phosphotransferase family protein [Actinomycetota bacterium]